MKSAVLVLYVGVMAILISAVAAQFDSLESMMASGELKVG